MNSPARSRARPLRSVGLFLAAAVPVWVVSQLLWNYGGGANLWPLKNLIELVSIGVAALTLSVLFVVLRRRDASKTLLLLLWLGVFAFLLGGFKASNDYLDLPDLLLGLAAQGVAFAYLLTISRPRPSAIPHDP